MTSSFAIQASQPRTEASYDPDDESLCDAVQSTFPLRTESMLIVWNGVYIPLGYKYDVSFIVDDGLDLLDAMLTSATGRRTIHWPSNTFASSWVVEWDPSNVVIEATWRAVIGGTEAMLEASGPVTGPVDAFTCEWKRPLEIVDAAVRSAGYSEQQIPRLALLSSVAKRIPGYGQLYVARAAPY